MRRGSQEGMENLHPEGGGCSEQDEGNQSGGVLKQLGHLPLPGSNVPVESILCICFVLSTTDSPGPPDPAAGNGGCCIGLTPQARLLPVPGIDGAVDSAFVLRAWRRATQGTAGACWSGCDATCRGGGAGGAREGRPPGCGARLLAVSGGWRRGAAMALSPERPSREIPIPCGGKFSMPDRAPGAALA